MVVKSLLFKRVVNNRVEMKFIEVMIPELNDDEGWTLINVADDVDIHRIEKVKSVAQIEEEEAVEEFIEEYRKKKLTSLAEDTIKTERMIIEAQKTEEEPVKEVENPQPLKPLLQQLYNIRKFPSDVQGTARLIRNNTTIRIAYRNGKQANMTDPNSVCINDYDKQMFFNNVRREKGQNVSNWSLNIDDHEQSYKYWNEFIDRQYKVQKDDYIKKTLGEQE